MIKNKKLLLKLLTLNQKETYGFLRGVLSRYYKNPHFDKDYIYCKGTLPILLVAHMDTVYDHEYRRYGYFKYEQKQDINNKQIFYDNDQQVIWSPQGLGADDKAGIYLILRLLQNNLRPHVLFTTDEEIGGFGAESFAQDYKKVLKRSDIKYIIELDRQGKEDCVFYDCANEEFENFINSFGFITEYGSFSDISTICPACGIAGVNLSVGYYQEHTLGEYMSILQNDKIYDIIYYMVKESEKVKDRFIYKTEALNFNVTKCACCDMTFPFEQLTYVSKMGYLCKDCLPFFK